MYRLPAAHKRLIISLQMETIGGWGLFLAILPAYFTAISSIGKTPEIHEAAVNLALVQMGITLCCVAAAYWTLIRHITFNIARYSLLSVTAGIGAVTFFVLNKYTVAEFACLATPVITYIMVQWRTAQVHWLINEVGQDGISLIRSTMDW